jgi:hypothetical protein
VPSMLLFFCGQVGILLHLLLQPPTRSDQLHSTQILYLLHVRQQCKSQKDISLNRSDCKRSSWWTISKPRNHFSSNAHWAVDGNSPQITNKKNPILHIH